MSLHALAALPSLDLALVDGTGLVEEAPSQQPAAGPGACLILYMLTHGRACNTHAWLRDHAGVLWLQPVPPFWAVLSVQDMGTYTLSV